VKLGTGTSVDVLATGIRTTVMDVLTTGVGGTFQGATGERW
jgi:hypothetical protein